MRDNDMKVYRVASRPSGNAQKKSSRPTQPGNRSAFTQKKQTPIFSRFVSFCKQVYWGRVVLVLLAIVGAFYILSLLVDGIAGAVENVEDKRRDTPGEYIFFTEENVRTESKRYELTDAERREVASVVTAEAGGEPYEGKIAVAQCILQACEDDGIRPTEAVVKYKYAKSRPEPTEEALEAVEAVFDLGQVATDEPIKYFYAPALCQSEWHESQVYVVTINGHKFFKEAK